MTPDELKSMPKGHFIVTKTGVYPMRTRLKLFLEWGITFGKPYKIEEKSARKVEYANRHSLEEEIIRRNAACEADLEEKPEPDSSASAGIQHAQMAVPRYISSEVLGMDLRRGDVCYANLMPVIGCEQGGVRPVLIIQNDIGNRFSPTVIVAAITSRLEKSPLPTHVPLTGEQIGLQQNSIVMLEQIRTIDRSRLRAYLGRVGDECLWNVDEALGVSLGLFIKQAEIKEEQYETSMALLPHRRAGGSKRRAEEAGKTAL